MTPDTDFDRLADAWMAEGPMDLADNVLFGALDEIHRTRQRRPLVMAWRPFMSNPPFRAATLAADLVVGGLAAVGIARSLPAVGTPPSPMPSGLPVPTAPDATEAPTSPTPSSSLPDGLFAPLGYDGSGTIAFTRSDPALDGGAVWLVDPSGAREAQIEPPSLALPSETFGGTGCCTVFSPDGRRLATSFDTPSGIMRGLGLVLKLDGSYVQWAPGPCVGCGSAVHMIVQPTTWSPDGDSVASRASSDDDPSRNGIYIWHPDAVADMATWETQVTGAHDDIPIAYSPDGTKLLFIRAPGANDNGGPLFVLDVATGTVTQVTPDGVWVYTDGYFGGGASWSPDGSRIAWSGTDENGNVNRMSVRISKPDGSDVVTKSTPQPFITSAHWSPDGAWIAYDAPGTNSLHDLFVVDPDSDTTRNLTEDFVPGVCCARWSPDSRALLVAGTEGENEQSVLLAVPLDGSGIRQITTTESFYSDYSWGPASR